MKDSVTGTRDRKHQSVAETATAGEREKAKAMRVGDWVQVRSEAEILQTLDGHGRLEGVPFMPEMFRFCGQVFQVYKRAHKTCDGISRQSRRIAATVHLDTRCSGEAHGGCQSECLLFWKDAWLRPVEGPRLISIAPFEASHADCNPSSSPPKEAVLAYAVVAEGGNVRYRCQATQIREASTRLRWWNMRQYLEDIRSGNVDGWSLARGAATALWLTMSCAGMGMDRLVRWLYDHFRFLWRGEPFPRRVGRIPTGQRTPLATLNLRAGELVRVRTLEEIERTLDTAGRNRGLYFDPEQSPYADHTFRVGRRVDRIICEETGRMIELNAPTVVLDSVLCQGRHSACRMFCPKNSYLLWREAWLERVNGGTSQVSGDARLPALPGEKPEFS